MENKSTGGSTTKERKIQNERQVLGVEELVVGKEYVAHHGGRRAYREGLIIEEIIYVDRGLGGTAEKPLARVWNAACMNIGADHVTSLADRGVVPYENGEWNSTNWLEHAEGPRSVGIGVFGGAGLVVTFYPGRVLHLRASASAVFTPEEIRQIFDAAALGETHIYGGVPAPPPYSKAMEGMFGGAKVIGGIGGLVVRVLFDAFGVTGLKAGCTVLSIADIRDIFDAAKEAGVDLRGAVFGNEVPAEKKHECRVAAPTATATPGFSRRIVCLRLRGGAEHPEETGIDMSPEAAEKFAGEVIEAARRTRQYFGEEKGATPPADKGAVVETGVADLYKRIEALEKQIKNICDGRGSYDIGKIIGCLQRRIKDLEEWRGR